MALIHANKEDHSFLFDHLIDCWGFGEIGAEFQDIELQHSIIKNRYAHCEKLINEKLSGVSIPDVLVLNRNYPLNGHALLHKEDSWAFVIASHFKTQLYSDVFLSHEIAHAIHYRSRPEFFFQNKNERNHFGRSLLTEGIATYFTKVLLNCSLEDALWADYLEKEKRVEWIDMVESEVKQIANHCLKHYDSIEPEYSLFYYTCQNSIFSRSGYWMGYQIIEHFASEHKLGLSELFFVDRKELSIYAREMMAALI